MWKHELLNKINTYSNEQKWEIKKRTSSIIHKWIIKKMKSNEIKSNNK